MKRRVLSAAVLAGAGLVAFGSSGDRAATSGPQAAQYVVVRTNSGPTSVNVSVGFGEGGAPAFGGLVGATVSAGQIDQVGIGITAIDNHRPDPVVKAGHRWVDGCAVGKCEVDEVLASGFAVSYWDSGQPDG